MPIKNGYSDIMGTAKNNCLTVWAKQVYLITINKKFETKAYLECTKTDAITDYNFLDTCILIQQINVAF